ncbi:MAG: 30S ribosomal protein S8 [Planctomycetota bacterium]|nr:30S ribosomal protein S8 [Planctomycetota bacterium]
MTMSDPIADMLTRIRNAVNNRAKTVNVKSSNVCKGIAAALKDEGYIEGFDHLDDGRQGVLRIKLRYGPRGEVLLTHLKRESTPGRRVYRGVNDLKRPLQGLGVAILSTPKGVLSDRKCVEMRLGGELLATVY